jgi:hypothetical protein
VLKNLIDDSEATDWQASATQGADGAWNVDGKQATIDLAGSRPQTIRHVQVPADAPRPVAPMLLLRNFTFSPVRATHLRIVARNTQCTGGPAYQGEQDADPGNATDCNIAGPLSTRFVRVAEVQAFGANSAAQG